MKKVKTRGFLQLLGIMLLCSACVSCYSEWEGLRELKKLCAKDAGLKIYKTVEDDGYYDTTGGFDLVTSPYKFYEFCNDPSSFTKFDVIPEPGCYRVEKIKRIEGECHPAYANALAKVVVDPYPEFLKENCIAVKKIDKPEARYSYHSELSAWLARNKYSEFIRSDSYIKDKVTSQVIGRYVSYSHNIRPKHSSPKSCHTIDSNYLSYYEANLIESVIKPVNN